MKKMLLIIAMVLLTGSIMTLHAQNGLTPDSVSRMTIEELKQQLDSPNVIVIDVRASHDWEDSATKIKGAIRENASKATSWMAKYPPSKTLVFYCS